MKILVAGVAGSLGSSLAKRLLGRGDAVVGVDNLSGCGALCRKADRLSGLGIRDAASLLGENRAGDGTYPAPSRFCGKFRFYLCDVASRDAMSVIFERERFDVAVNLAVKPGTDEFQSVLECCRKFGAGRLVYIGSGDTPSVLVWDVDKDSHESYGTGTAPCNFSDSDEAVAALIGAVDVSRNAALKNR